ncbi:MAG: hypothetical protein ACRDTJ_19285 [Pseudonocardiaceae bacterium]
MITGASSIHPTQQLRTPAGEPVEIDLDMAVAELAELESAVMEVMKLHEDSVVQIELGPLHVSVAVRTLGRPRWLPATGLRIV